MFTQAYVQTAVALVQAYTGPQPFHLVLKSFFAAHKQFGSRDRKHITHLCYAWFRAGRLLPQLPTAEQFAYALFLTGGPEKLLQQLAPHLIPLATGTVMERIAHAQAAVGFPKEALFPWWHHLSAEIDAGLFQQSFLVQPDLFLRLRPGREAAVAQALTAATISFQHESAQCLRLANAARVDAVLVINRDAVVQDLNSQKVLHLFIDERHGHLKKFATWDCCAASGGKALLLLDAFPHVQLTVSDVRPTILHNLRKRFAEAGIQKYNWFVANAATDTPPRGQTFDLILCDVPCTGSGTWSRTPENLVSFSPEKIETYAQLQKNIIANAQQFVKRGGYLLYSTCSVFSAENEAVVAWLAAQPGMRFLKSSYYKGYTQKADTLFAALFQSL